MITRNPDQTTYNAGTQVTVTAVPNTGYAFTSWGGDLSGSTNPAAIAMTGNKTVTAAFTQNEYTLNVTVVGNGTITRDNAGPYHLNDVVTLTAVADAGWTFTGWSECTGTLPCSVTMDGNKTITATFTQIEYSLTVTPGTGGSVTKSPDQGTYHYGDVVQPPSGSGCRLLLYWLERRPDWFDQSGEHHH